ncbi:hypothetical protein I317_04471 [Kwoniella heveanensis CBS 569]|nr:hypothetical protein I317_04471 [Kwoniella heveanensis CBS 569]
MSCGNDIETKIRNRNQEEITLDYAEGIMIEPSSDPRFDRTTDRGSSASESTSISTSTSTSASADILHPHFMNHILSFASKPTLANMMRVSRDMAILALPFLCADVTLDLNVIRSSHPLLSHSPSATTKILQRSWNDHTEEQAVWHSDSDLSDDRRALGTWSTERAGHEYTMGSYRKTASALTQDTMLGG